MSKKIIFGLLMICVVAGLVAVGTWAYFSDVEYSEDNTFAAGSLDLKVDGMDDPNVATYFEVECVKPGDMGEATIILTNEGCCVPANGDIHIMNLVDEENGLKEPEVVLGDTGPVGELSQYMWITMTALDAGGAMQWYQEGWLDVLHCQNFIIGPLDPGTAVTVVITWEIPAGTGNIIMTDTVNFDIEFSLDQRVGAPADMSLTGIVQPSTAIICDAVTVSVDVTNDGENTGSVPVTLEIDGWSQTKTVTVAGKGTETVNFDWHADASGVKAVTASIPDDGLVGPHVLECPGGIEVFAPPSFEATWEPQLPVEVYVCDMLTVGAILHNIGDVSATVDVTLTIEVDGVEKLSETVPGVTLDPCAPTLVVFEPWHVCDPVVMTGNLVVSIGGVPVLTGSITIIDNDPVFINVVPATCTSVEPGDIVHIEVDGMDDGGILGVGYTIDDPMAMPILMTLTSGDPLNGHYESMGTDWDTTGAALGDHTIYVGGMDGAGNMGGNAAIVHVEKAVFDFTNLVVDPNPAYECDQVTISIDVHNGGNISGTVTITVNVDGTDYTDTVTLAPCDSYTASWTFHVPEAGSYTVAGHGLGTTLVVNAPQLQESSTWVYDVHYDTEPNASPAPAPLPQYIEDRVFTLHLVETGVYPVPDMEPLCLNIPMPTEVCGHVVTTISGATADFTRWMWNADFGANLDLRTTDIDAWNSEVNSMPQYVYTQSFMMGFMASNMEISYDDYTIVSGSQIGTPYENGASWTSDSHADGFVMGACIGPMDTLDSLITVVAENQTVTVPAGTFTDCFELQTVTATGMKTEWYSPTAMAVVKSIDDNSQMLGIETRELTSYTLVW